MIAPPMTDQEVEQARARVSSETQQIYSDTEKAVNAEIERLDAAKTWAEGEMDRNTAAALADLDLGKDPDAVRKQLDLDLQATITKASAPDFDPRKLQPKIDAVPRAPITPVAIPIAPAATPAVEPPAAPASAPSQEPVARACACNEGAPPSIVLAIFALALTRRIR